VVSSHLLEEKMNGSDARFNELVSQDKN
jgi:hypothetical protein